MKLYLLIEYDGTRYAGWQVQIGQRTIQGEIERALATIFHQSIRVIGAGRTDSGVHARGQIAHIDVINEIALSKLKRALNGLLARDIRIKEVKEANSDFHARYSATGRKYHYIITKKPSALIRNYSWHLSYDLNIDRMQDAAFRIQGKHDFKSFCKSLARVNNYDCQVDEAQWVEESDTLKFVIKSNRFLHGMVRALVGTFVDVGKGKLIPEEIEQILSKRNRIYASQSAPAQGLILERVYY
jgi:tRNA pseudouridine38-40 synthase